MLSRFVLRSNFPVRRLISTGFLLRTDSTPKSVSKEALSNLRKKTGYSFVNCRKALLQFGENNLDEAEKWLRETAKKEGWAKAQKLSNRQASQGLVAVLAKSNVGAVLELNCETDFVARSADFKDLVEEISLAIVDYGKKIADSKAPSNKDEFVSISVDDSISTQKNRTVKESIALAVGKMRENIVVKKAQAIISNPAVLVQACAHPQYGTEAVHMGQFASVIGVIRDEAKAKFPNRQIHIIGMRPEVLGTPAKHEKTRLELLDEKEFKDEKEHDDLNDFADVQSTQLDEDETQLLRQTFMFSPALTVHEYLDSHSARVEWFLRLEVGEDSDA
ncbi:Elongation factor Ts, mitochondrial [Aphelenchoides bicaudatus]|nr:Elongation factor Ts, mitochondrial [Aphelenchoides bicaudatus]